jgi:hypothetical protein
MARRVPEGPPPPPVVQRIRIRYAKRGRLRFTSHRDFARAFERALRRAEIPMGYSAGFTPHPKISYVGASPTGAGSEAEYLEIGLAREMDLEWVRSALEAVEQFLARDEVGIERLTKSGRRVVDTRAPVVRLSVLGAAADGNDQERAILEVVVRQVIPAVRPDDIVAALSAVAGLAPAAPPIAVRLAQGPLDAHGAIGDPLAPDREHVTSPP